MTAGVFSKSLTIYRGTKFEHLLTFVDSSSGAPLDLTGLSPFVCVLSNPRTKAKLATLTVTNTDLSGGQLTIAASESQTTDLPLGPVLLGLRDDEGNPYILDSIKVDFFPL